MNKNSHVTFEAVEKNDQARLLMSLARGLDPNVLDHKGRSLLIAACQSDQASHSIVQTLMDYGADRGLIGPNGRTALHELCAKKTQNMQTLQMFLQSDVELNRQDNKGQTPLHALAERGWIEGCMELLESSPIPKGLCNQKDEKGQTPLFLASDHPEIVCLLVSYGADPRIQNNDGLSAVEKVKDLTAMAMVIAKSKILDNFDEISMSVSNKQDEEFENLMKHGKVVLAKDFLSKKNEKKLIDRSSKFEKPKN